MTTLHVAVVSSRLSRVLAGVTSRRAFGASGTLRVTVLDVDGTYVAGGDEAVLAPRDVGVDDATLHREAVLREPAHLERWLQPRLVRHLLRQDADRVVLALRPGVVLLADPVGLAGAAREHGIVLVARSPDPTPDDALWPGPREVAAAGAHTAALVTLHGDADAALHLWERHVGATARTDDRWTDVVASALPHHTDRDRATLLSAWNLGPGTSPGARDGTLSVDGRPVVALDLSAFDVRRPWLLATDLPAAPRARLSDHPALARLCAAVAAEAAATGTVGSAPRATRDLDRTSLGVPVHPHLREIYRAAYADEGAVPPPDPFAPEAADELAEWLTAPLGGGLGRYLTSVYRTRPDLRAAFPGVPGEHIPNFLDWARDHAPHEPAYSPELLELAVGRAQPPAPIVPAASRPPGVTVVGHLRGELGIGESARLVVAGLAAADVPHATRPVEQHVMSRQNAAFVASASTQPFDTTLLCVNADHTPAVAAMMPALLAGSHRIGMWYWEVEEFPAEQHVGFAHVDEVWVATEFVRAAVAPHSPVPVVTMPPPLPQRHGEPAVTREHFGLPDRPLFLFSFDYLSTVERKNPLGLLDAFAEAFTAGEGPVLVIKSINGERRPEDAEQLRLRAATRPDVVLLETYLDAAERDALVALCDCYVSLHRSEGLGLTMAEAMAWGKPVVATRYGGNVDFMTDENSFLVPWTPAPIPARAAPYPAGTPWADPDLQAAAALMRGVLDRPADAVERAERAAADIRALHSPGAAGTRMAARLEEIRAERSAARAHERSLAARLGSRVRRLGT